MSESKKVQPKVSVIIPVYNTEKYLRECLDSVVNQTLRDIEIICVDDGSTDSSPAILQEYAERDERFTILRQENTGAGAARNKGLDIAKGEYLYFLDSDDWCDVTLLEKTTKKADDTEADIVAFDHERINVITGVKEFRRGINGNYPDADKIFFNYETHPYNILSVINPVPWNKLIRHSLIEQWDLRFEELPSTNDITFSALCNACSKKLVYVPEVLITYRINVTGQISSNPEKPYFTIKALTALYAKTKILPNYKTIKISLQIFSAKNLFFALEHYAGEKYSENYEKFYKTMKVFFMQSELFFQVNNLLNVNKDIYNRINICTRYFIHYPIIVSFTTIPRRFEAASIVARTMLDQTIRVDKVVLYIGETECPEKEESLPESLRQLLSNERFEIRFREDIGPHGKYFYAMQEFPDSVIITVDDDINYPFDLVEKLLVSYARFPYAVNARRGRRIIFNDDGKINPYVKWPLVNGDNYIPTMDFLATGVGGVLYPPNCMDKMLFDVEKIRETCLYADDLWLKVIQIISKTPVVISNSFDNDLDFIAGTQQVRLYNSNISDNDRIFKSILDSLDLGNSVFNELLFSYRWEKLNSSKKNEIDSLRYKLDRACYDYNCIKESFSFRVGRIITWLPRKLREAIRCLKEHGLTYTFK